MPYLGNDPGKLGTVLIDSFTGDGSAVAFTLVRESPNTASLLVAIDGVIQHPTDAWSVSGVTLTFTAAPDSSADIRVWHLSTFNTVDVVEDGAITTAKLNDGAITSAKLNAAVISGHANIGATPAGSDELLLSDGGVLKAVTVTNLSAAASWSGGAITGDIDMEDDKGLILGSGDDYWLGLNAGETELELVPNGAQGSDTNEGIFSVLVGDGATSTLTVKGGEGGSAIFYLQCDQGDDTDDRWFMPVQVGYSSELYLDNQANQVLETYQFKQNGTAQADATWNDNAWDYAELFQWATPLADDDAVKDLYGLSVVLDNGKVRIAEAGEEAQVLGIIRAKGSTASHGDALRWHNKYKKDVWGVEEYEPFVMVNWQEDGYRHAYHSDEIPAYRLRDDVGRTRNWHTNEEHFKLDKDGDKIPVVVPQTDEEKEAVNYTERTVHKTSGEPLMRRVYNPSYDEEQAYIMREDRPKEWVLIGLLGQVPVRDGAIIPDHWTFMENLEEGVDKYFIK